jgi:hypothetical protein
MGRGRKHNTQWEVLANIGAVRFPALCGVGIPIGAMTDAIATPTTPRLSAITDLLVIGHC